MRLLNAFLLSLGIYSVAYARKGPRNPDLTTERITSFSIYAPEYSTVDETLPFILPSTTAQVAHAGDYSAALVTNPFADNGARTRIQVWKKTGGAWAEEGSFGDFGTDGVGLTMSDNAVIGTFGTNVYVIHNKKGAWEQATFTAPVSLGTSVSVADDTASQSTFTVQDNNAVYVNRLTFDANGNPSWTTTQTLTPKADWAEPLATKVFQAKVFGNVLAVAVESSKPLYLGVSRYVYGICIYERPGAGSAFALEGCFDTNEKGAYISKPQISVSNKVVLVGEEYAKSCPNNYEGWAATDECGFLNVFTRGRRGNWKLATSFIPSDARHMDEFAHRIDHTDNWAVVTMKAQDRDCSVSLRCAIYVIDLSNPSKPLVTDRYSVANVDRLRRYIAVAMDKKTGASAVVSTRRGVINLERTEGNWDVPSEVSSCSVNKKSPSCSASLSVYGYDDVALLTVSGLQKTGPNRDLSLSSSGPASSVPAAAAYDLHLIANPNQWLNEEAAPVVLASRTGLSGNPSDAALQLIEAAGKVGSRKTVGVLLMKTKQVIGEEDATPVQVQATVRVAKP